MSNFDLINSDIVACERCPRLIQYCREVALTKKRAFSDDDYWGKPVPGFGDPEARILIVGLAPAAHGSNRTGRPFTGDGADGMGAGDFLARALHRAGIASQPTSQQRNDGYALSGAYLTAIVRCAPPGNKPTRSEIENCSDYLRRRVEALTRLRVFLALGKLAFDQMVRALREMGAEIPRPQPKFGHGVVFEPGSDLPLLVGAYHPSRQNTQTGLLTESMFDEVISIALGLAEEG